MAFNVRYRVGGDNSVLRAVLHDEWRGRCYWCKRPKEFADVEIDHIVPKSLHGEYLSHVLANLGLTGEFDRNDPANLAPICRDCNSASEKGNRDLSAPLFLSKLEKARELRETVVLRVETFDRSGRTSKAMLLLREADLRDSGTRSAFRELGAAVAQKIAMAGEDLLDFAVRQVLSVDIDDDRGCIAEVDIVLNKEGRRALAVMEDLFYIDLGALLSEPITDLRDEVIMRCQNSLEALKFEDYSEPLNAGDPDIVSFRYEINSLEMERVGRAVECKVGGDFDASLSASIVRIDWQDEGLHEMQGESTVSGEFSFVLSGDLLDDKAQVEAGNALVEVGDESHWIE